MISVNDSLPGADIVSKGLSDLAGGVSSVEAHVVSIGAPRLRFLGLDVPAFSPQASPEHDLYAMLAAADPDSAHSRYNALIRRLVSFERALACVR